MSPGLPAPIYAESNNRGELECGCVVSLVVSAEPPRGNVRWCLTHAHAQKLRQAMNLVAGYTMGAENRILSGGFSPSRSIEQLKQIREWATAALPPKDTAGYVKTRGPGKGAI